ncbi:hotdog fold thioesterase, partial [Micromonospora azadirachtae]
MFAADPASRGLGIELVEAADGAAVARMRVTDTMINGHAIAHGGFVFLLADTAFALACNSWGPATVAAGGEISFVRPAR